VTEGGYLDHQHRLDTANADLADDLRCALDGSGTPRTIYGAIAAILRAQQADPQAALTLLNCDNLRHNGERFRDGLRQFLHPAWRSGWCLDGQPYHQPQCHGRRITPRPTPAVAPREGSHRHRRPLRLMGESFIQWVIEDDFKAGRPRLEAAGVEMVQSVLPYEEAKIRILNASHSCIAWAGTLAGLQYIHEGTLREDIRQMAHDYVTQDDPLPHAQPDRPGGLPRYDPGASPTRPSRTPTSAWPPMAIPRSRLHSPDPAGEPGRRARSAGHRHAAGAVPGVPAALAAGALPYEYQDGIFDAAAAPHAGRRRCRSRPSAPMPCCGANWPGMRVWSHWCAGLWTCAAVAWGRRTDAAFCAQSQQELPFNNE
jgi:D-arabinitol 4-dehydrogenase